MINTASLHGPYPVQTAGVNLHSGMPPTDVIAPSSNIGVNPSERWHNVDPSRQIQPSADQQSFISLHPSNQGELLKREFSDEE